MNPQLRIVSSLTATCISYLTSLKKLVKNPGIEKRVHFHIDAPLGVLRKILSRSKVGISTNVEYFVTAIVEQMASGCVPIVYQIGRSWEDIVEYGKYGYGFETVDDLVATIDKLFSDEELALKKVKLKENEPRRSTKAYFAIK